MTLITMNGNKIVTKNGGIATETDCCECPCPVDTCTDSCACGGLTQPQPAIKVWDLGCEAHCTGGVFNGVNVPIGSQTESIPYYASTFPPLINGCCFTLWRLTEDNAKETPCFAEGESAPVPLIYVTLQCCPGVPEYTITYRYYHNPVLTNETAFGGTPKTQKLCVVDGILKGCVILDLVGPGAASVPARPNCQLRLIFGNAE